MAGKKYCIRCGHEMWYDETKKRWYCTNKKCVKYKEPPQPETTDGQDEPATDTNVGGK